MPTQCLGKHSSEKGASQEAPVVKNLPAMQETLVRSLGQKDPLEKEWRILIVIVTNNVLYSPDYFCKFHNELQLQIFIAF